MRIPPELSFLKPLFDTLPPLGTYANSEAYGWVFKRLLTEYIRELAAVSSTPDNDLIKQKARLQSLFNAIQVLNTDARKKGLDGDDQEE